MQDLQILLVVSFVIFVSPYIAKFIKTPTSATEIIFGILLANFGLLGNSENFKIIANFGFYYLMFLAGMHVNMRIFLKINAKILRNSIVYLFLIYFLSASLIFAFNLNMIFFIVLPVISIGVLMTLFKEYGNNQKWLNLAMFVGCIGEVVSITLLTFGAGYLQSGFSFEFFKVVFCFVLFILVCIASFKSLEIIFWWLPNLKKILVPQADKDEKDIRLCMALFLFIVAIMMILDIEVVIGAFVAGSFISTFFDNRKDLPHKLSSFGFGFFVPIFFIHIGSTIDIKFIFDKEIILNSLLIVFAMILIKILPAFIFLKQLKFLNTILFGFSLCMPLTLLVATATLALKAGSIDKNLYISFIIASLIEAIFVLFAIKFLKNYKKINSPN